MKINFYPIHFIKKGGKQVRWRGSTPVRQPGAELSEEGRGGAVGLTHVWVQAQGFEARVTTDTRIITTLIKDMGF